MALYKYGDKVKVKTNGSYKIGKVISVKGDIYNGIMCTVDFDNPPVLVPQKMDLPESFLEPHDEKINVFGHWIDTDDVCPICRQNWHKIEHPIHGGKIVWRDCLKCKKTKEQLMKEIGK